MSVSMLTTLDNPFNPFTQYKEWNDFDVAMGYDTFVQLARMTFTSHELSPEDYDVEYERGIDKFLALNPTGNYRRIYQENNIDIKEE